METPFFIPHIVTVKEIRIPSTPFNLNKGKALFLGDVFEVQYPDEPKEVFMAQIKDGQYVGISDNINKDVPLWVLEESVVNVLGSSIEFPELLNLLSK